jgi:hypothetical protein
MQFVRGLLCRTLGRTPLSGREEWMQSKAPNFALSTLIKNPSAIRALAATPHYSRSISRASPCSQYA